MRFQFAGYRFDPERGLEGAAGRVPLRPMETRLLHLLLEADGCVVSKDSIVSRVWGNRPVTDD
jgi:DNA-binding winged helix-turn-helix (wHTH) protein